MTLKIDFSDDSKGITPVIAAVILVVVTLLVVGVAFHPGTLNLVMKMEQPEPVTLDTNTEYQNVSLLEEGFEIRIASDYYNLKNFTYAAYNSESELVRRESYNQDPPKSVAFHNITGEGLWRINGTYIVSISYSEGEIRTKPQVFDFEIRVLDDESFEGFKTRNSINDFENSTMNNFENLHNRMANQELNSKIRSLLLLFITISLAVYGKTDDEDYRLASLVATSLLVLPFLWSIFVGF